MYISKVEIIFISSFLPNVGVACPLEGDGCANEIDGVVTEKYRE